MKTNVRVIRNAAFYVMLAVLLLSLSSLTALLDVLYIPFGLAGLAVVLLTIRLQEAKLQKAFFFLAGGSGTALLFTCAVFSLLRWSGHTPGGDGGGITVPMLILCPLVFIVSAVGCFVFLIKGKPVENRSTPHPPA